MHLCLRYPEKKGNITLNTQNVAPDKNEIISFRNVKLPQYEIAILRELEKKLKKVFNIVGEIEWHTQMGITVDNQHITKIGLYDCRLSKLPESFGELASLNELYLSSNKLKFLPSSFGDLKSLEILELNENQLKTLPESIGDLSSLKNFG